MTSHSKPASRHVDRKNPSSKKVAKEESADTLRHKARATHAKASKKTLTNALETDLSDLQRRLEDYEDLLKRHQAEFENYRKRTQKEAEQHFHAGVRDVLESLLPIVDNFERALSSDSPSKPPSDEDLQNFLKSYQEGVHMIYHEIAELLKKFEVTPIGKVGERFDPQKHQALQHDTVHHKEGHSQEKDVISELYQKGYMIHDKVLRNAQVKVTKHRSDTVHADKKTFNHKE